MLHTVQIGIIGIAIHCALKHDVPIFITSKSSAINKFIICGANINPITAQKDIIIIPTLIVKKHDSLTLSYFSAP